MNVGMLMMFLGPGVLHTPRPPVLPLRAAFPFPILWIQRINRHSAKGYKALMQAPHDIIRIRIIMPHAIKHSIA